RSAAGRSRSPAGPSSGEGEALELEHLGSRVGDHLADGLRAVVDPLLLGEDVRPEKALVQHPFDDLLTRLLRLRLHLVGVREDLALRRDELLGNVLAADPPGIGPRDVHREVPRQLFGAALDLDEDAELVGRWMDVGTEPAVDDGLEPGRPGDGDVLAEL